MAKIKPHEIDSAEKYKIIGNFFDIVASLKSKKEVINFFMGLLTQSESVMMARRIQIAQGLIEGESYSSIKNQLGVSFHTIAKTDKWLHSEDEKYNQWLSKCLKRKKTAKKNRFESGRDSLLDRYSHHRFIKDILNS